GASAFAGAEHAVRLDEPQAVADLPGFADGDVSVQDAAAQLAAPWLLAGGGDRILDACAAPGGKSCHLLELGGSGIELTCVDRDEMRLGDVTANLARLGLNATVLPADASNPEEWWDRKPFDAILLDAPCSASGVIRRHPDIKLLRRETDVATLSALQGELLGTLWGLLVPGGRLLYATCSVLAAENDDVVNAFLAATPGAQENDMLQNNNIRDVMRRKACGYQVLPGTAGLDGFYYACLEKKSRDA
ncbi:MAG: 16S rRNA (cytosine(967)-C(5))-methyltransferase, partial [Woeseiaceae bacterium]